MVAPVEVTVDAKGMPLPPVDPNVVVPPRVKAEAARAAELHAQAYTPQPDPSTPPVSPQPVAPPIAPVTPVAPVMARPAPVDDRASWDAAKWMQHAKSMEGRFKQSQDTIATLQSNMSEITDALAKTQVRQPVNQPPPPLIPPTPLITKEDVETYGQDFLSVAQRAAMEAVRPTLDKLAQQNQQLERKLQTQANQNIEISLDAEVPNWAEINVSPKFKAWLRLRDIYSGQVRQDLLNQAHRAADAARVVRFFKGFLSEEEATGSTEFLTAQQPALNTPPVTPSVELQSLAAPGHAKPATGVQPQPADAPIWITRGQITQFYKNVRSGVYAGREQDRMNDEAIIFECQRTGRVR